MHWLKSAILAIFQKSADVLDWPCMSIGHVCPVSAALKNGSLNFFYLSYFNFFLNMKPLSEVVPRLLVIQIQIQAV